MSDQAAPQPRNTDPSAIDYRQCAADADEIAVRAPGLPNAPNIRVGGGKEADDGAGPERSRMGPLSGSM